MGGNRAGEVASSQGTQKLISDCYAGAKKPLIALQQAFKQTNLHICDLGMSNPVYRRMATTLSAIALVGGQAHIGHVGDTRIYQLRDSSIQQLTRDHSEVGELVRMQILTPEEAQRHPRRHIITRSIGEDLMTRIDFRGESIQAGDSFVLCTDGLWEPLVMQEIAEIVQNTTAAVACQHLVALALNRGTVDNLLVQVVKVVELAGDSLEYVHGVTLRQVLRKEHRLLIECAVSLGVPIAQALAYAHTHHVFHRDLKPENIIVTPEGCAKVMDFGIAFVAGARRVTWGQMLAQVGTPVDNLDQRGVTRPQGAHCDIGAFEAFEFQEGTPTATPTKTPTSTPTPTKTPTATPTGPSCGGQVATIYVNTLGRIVGGPDNSKRYIGELIGTSSTDVIVGTGGKDNIKGKGGDDIICGATATTSSMAALGMIRYSAGQVPTNSTVAPGATARRTSR